MQYETEYKNYFKDHVKCDFTRDWIIKDSDFVFNQLKIILKYVDNEKLIKNPVLEVGSGLGRFAYLLENLGVRDYTGIELDESAVSCARQQFSNENYRFEVQDLFKLRQSSLGKKKYDHVFLFEVLEHLSNPLLALNILNTLLPLNGTLIATTPYPFKKNIVGDETHLSVLHPLNWQRLLEKAGFKVIIIRPMTFVPYLWRIHKKLNFILPFYFGGLKLVSTSLIIAEKIHCTQHQLAE